jgi:hypothetical protein
MVSFKPNQCPIGEEVDKAVYLGREFNRTIKKLRRSMNNCSKCESEEECLIIQRFQVMGNEIIQEINSEWNLQI